MPRGSLRSTATLLRPLSPLQVLYEDNHLLAVNKPAGLGTMGLPHGKTTLLDLAKEYLKRKYDKPGNVYLGIVSRLDVPVSGVVLLARTSKAAARLTEQFRERQVEKTYWAVVEGRLPEEHGELTDWLRKDDRHRKMHAAAAGAKDAQEARLSYRRLNYVARGTLLEIRLHTGRKHQIRLQLSAHGYPTWGDLKYGGRESFSAGIALHALRLIVEHPTRHEPVEVQAPLPSAWRMFGVETR